MTEKEETRGSEQRVCIACAEPIRAKATLCGQCDSYQQPWKNAARYFAAIAAGVALVFAAGAYIISAIPSVRRTFAWRSDPRVVAFDSGRGITVLNAGDGAVLLSHVSLKIENIGTKTLAINRVVERAQALRHDWTIDEDGRFGDWILIGQASPVSWAQAVAKSGIGFTDHLHGKCYGAIVYSLSDPGYRMYEEHYAQHLRYAHATALLWYHDLAKGEGQISVPVRALLFYNGACRKQEADGIGR
jgi:hypothetical protein